MFYICYKRFRILSCLLFLFILYGILWYIGRLHFGSEFVKTDRLYVCLEDRIKSFNKKVSEFDAFVTRSNTPSVEVFPFVGKFRFTLRFEMIVVGNGYIGCSFQENKLLLQHLGYLSQSLDIPVLISLDVHGYISDSLIVLDIHDGIMYKMHCFKHENELCVSSGTMAYAHRIYTSLIVQNFRVYNPLNTAAVVKVNKDSVPNKKLILKRRTTSLKQKNLPGEKVARDVTYEIICGLITLYDEEFTDEDWKVPKDPHQSRHTAAHILVFVLFEPVFPDNLSVGAGE
ncbi:hypothetical protein D915_002255 [Fasciola hepatica]|uniref:Uncharacterized protein n=1 Tax=Fasciola hepatica TaxID=6192 RepID=A0A4E0RXY4_FASHE|nr:hypothetical protein D915_002255 [Fasciola hepatica]